jgi:hypothetical protein
MKNFISQIIEKVKGLFSSEPIDENKIKVNGMLSICFDNREVLDAIITFKKFEQAFENELKKRNLDALEVSADCEGYFHRKSKKLNQNYK